MCVQGYKYYTGEPLRFVMKAPRTSLVCSKAYIQILWILRSTETVRGPSALERGGYTWKKGSRNTALLPVLSLDR